ncbi:lipase 1 [Papilio machaon]|uniref:lipase 1 n=1 Tax=Papilio machaon TaxID=76193 RepID=UPI001E6660AE|nr:lipase 1 [Papilio machaon]
MALRAQVVSKFIWGTSLLLLAAALFLLPAELSNDAKSYLQYPKDSYLNFTTRTTKHGYITEEHTVTTEDGYLLTVFHLRSGKKHPGAVRRPPVVMMHGLLMSSDTWLDAGPDAALAYLLADAYFDLWLGNVRGNYYGRRHTKLDPQKDSEFWDFSTDEMGLYDVPATIDYVLNKTGADQVNYIGFSQGAGAFLIMCSELPDHCGKARSLIALAPATRLKYTKSLLVKLTVSQLKAYESALSAIGIKEVFSRGGFGQEILSFLCKYSIFTNVVCEKVIAIVDSDHAGSIKPKTLRALYGHFPAGTSVRTMARYGQALLSEGYRKYDHGETNNMKVYGTPTAPFHNLSAVRVPTYILHGNNDRLVDPADVRWLADRLPHVLERAEIDDPMWNHLDFMYSQHIRKLVLPKVLQYLAKYNEVDLAKQSERTMENLQ